MQNITYNIEYILDKEYVNDKIILTITGKEEGTIYNQHQRKGQINIVYKLYKIHTKFIQLRVLSLPLKKIKNIR